MGEEFTPPARLVENFPDGLVVAIVLDLYQKTSTKKPLTLWIFSVIVSPMRYVS
ncbi:MAG: hypothetical protein AAB444_00275 [Patescibacteria group bacterium]